MPEALTMAQRKHSVGRENKTLKTSQKHWEEIDFISFGSMENEWQPSTDGETLEKIARMEELLSPTETAKLVVNQSNTKEIYVPWKGEKFHHYSQRIMNSNWQ